MDGAAVNIARTQRYTAPTGHRLGAWHGKAKHGPEVVRQALTLHYQGFSYAKIGQRLGVSEWTIADWCQGKTRYVDAL